MQYHVLKMLYSQVFVLNMVNVGVRSGAVIDEWDRGTVKAALKDDGAQLIDQIVRTMILPHMGM